jgi:hypothetical protein
VLRLVNAGTMFSVAATNDLHSPNPVYHPDWNQRAKFRR